jgi:hypothetical protein
MRGLLMTSHATGGIEAQSWDEQAYEETDDGVKLARVTATNVFTGDVEGSSRVEFLLAYANDDYCSFVGIERVTGRLTGREGSFVLQQHGTFQDGGIRTEWFVVPGSGTGELAGLRGEGGYVWHGEHGVPAPFTLDYELGQ